MSSGTGLRRIFTGRRIISCIVFLLITCSIPAQNSTREMNPSPKEPRKNPLKKKVMIIPFEPKMYMSDIDRNINRETKLNFREIRDAFRLGLDKEIGLQFRNDYSVISMLRDTAKTNKDLFLIYSSISYKYTPTKGPDPGPAPKAIEKGQLVSPVESDEEKYMRTIILKPSLLTALNKKYGAELFIFISEIDMKGATPDGSPDREVLVHYTVYSWENKPVGGGLAHVKFSPELNDPKSIVLNVFPKLGKIIYTAATPPVVPANSGGKDKPKGK